MRSIISTQITRILTSLFRSKLSLQHPPQDVGWGDAVTYSRDCVRYSTLALVLRRIANERIPGAFAETGVFRGETSKFLHDRAPDRKLYLFDTFEGFPDKDLTRKDDRFRNTSIEMVKARIGNLQNVEFRAGYFPDTAAGLESETFAFVLLDMDLYNPTRAGLEFFYPRVSPGGFILLHDYNNVESEHAVARAADEFLRDKPEGLIDSPDMWGTTILRKARA